MNINKIRLDRRTILKAAGVGAGLSVGMGPNARVNASDTNIKNVTQSGVAAVLGNNGKPVLPWSNWSGNQHCQPTQRETPRNEEQVVRSIKGARQPIRCVGAGHSFSPLVPTSDTLMSLARLRGIEKIHEETQEVDIWAGTRLAQIGKPLWDAGLGLINMPDINTQGLAGAIATSTHGAGYRLGSMSSYVTRMRMVTAAGEIVECSATENPELFNAARNNLGALGVVTQLRLQARDSYKLSEYSWMMKLEEGLERAEELRDTNRHFEFYALPHADHILGLTLNETDKPIPEQEREGNGDAYETFRTLSQVVDVVPFLRRFIINTGASTVEPEEKIGRSYDVFGNLRDIRFNEMEYSVPAEYGVQCLKEILDTIKRENIDIMFPLEYRYVKQDDVWLSPFYQRDSCTISCHNFHDREYKKYFAAIEPVFLKYEGRPHWGKIHTLGARELAARYPMWNEFQRVRKEMDPQGLFLNSHLKELFALG